ncbi:hypothetical protein DTW90_36295 [Neorhizobium sp. P12A]|uniref:hypothetical protein n=1 Tax=Neorhizobium sp. P12A TaxID=2268027 RepID=UPI0011EDB68B|nr:hypothetical protein [Neorhizobium sp. P12A]KAA0683852.1 hypothetical protein DTW90_36295 [Neorhizobium sp. P12A]
MTFSLQTFGNLQLLDADGRIVSFPEKGLLVLSYLLSMQRESERRTTLARILWGGAGRDVEQVNLRKAISRIRSRQNQLGVEFLSFTDGMVSSGRTPITSDLLSLQGGDLTKPVARLRRLVALFDQPYLGPVRCQSPDFERWLVQCQNSHSDLLKALLKEAAASARGPEDDEVIKSAAILIFRTEPEDPDTLRLLIQLFNAEEEVEYFRTYFEQRKELLIARRSG